MSMLARSIAGGPGFDTPLLGPGSALTPLHQETIEPRRWDYQPGRNISTSPRAYEPLSFDTLRQLCKSYDIARIAIEARKDEARGWDWDIRVKPIAGLTQKDQKARSVTFSADVAQVKGFLQSPNQEDDFGTWLTMYLEDLFVIDAPTLYFRQTRGGDLFAAEVIDGATIKPIVDQYGRVPRIYGAKPPKAHMHEWEASGDGAVCSVCGWPAAYQQIVRGVPWGNYTAYELMYEPYHQVTTSPYGQPPIVTVLMTVNRALRRQTIDLTRFTEGTMPAAFYRLPETWNFGQLQELQALFDDLLAGDDVARSRVRFIPGGPGSGLDPMQPEVKGEVETWLMHVTAAAFGTSAYELGFEPNSGLGGAGFGDASRASAEKRGSKPLSGHLAGQINRIIAGPLGKPELEFTWRGLGETADQLKEAQRDELRWKAGAYSTDQWLEDQGLDPVGMGPSVFDPKIGVVLVADLLANAVATAAAAAALTDKVLDPSGMPEDTAGAQAAQQSAEASIGSVPSSVPGETTVGQSIGRPAVGPGLGKASADVDLALWQRKAQRAIRLGRRPDRFTSTAIDPTTAAVLRDRLSKAATVGDVRAAFAQEVTP